tara:strand:- start:274 stop:489 length:216 start_codon:yes stop_codon:yes gene_type:complete
MLDAFIIEKIKKDREESREAPRLRITPPEPTSQNPIPGSADNRDDSTQRGVVEIDFNLDNGIESDHIDFKI